MNRNIGETLRIPGSRAIYAGAVSVIAALAITGERTIGEHADGHDPHHIQPVPEMISGSTAGASSIDYQPAATAEEPGQSAEDKLRLGVPEPIQRKIDRDAVVIRGLGCSGMLIRGEQGEPIGALTANHCVENNLLPVRNPIVVGKDDKMYMVSKDPLVLETGSHSDNLTSVGEIKSFAVSGHGSIEQSLAILPGHNAREVIRTYNESQLSEEQIDQMHPNKTRIWVAGWPQIQDGDEAGNKIRQTLSTQYIGRFAFWSLSKFSSIKVAGGLFTENSNGSGCSWGLSGAQAMVVKVASPENRPPRKVVRSIGTTSFIIPFKPMASGNKSISKKMADRYLRIYSKKFPDTDMSGADGICAFGYKTVGINSYRLIHTVSGFNEVP